MTGDAREALESLVQEAFIDVYGEYHLAIPSDELRGRLMSLAAGFTLPRQVSTVEELEALPVGAVLRLSTGIVGEIGVRTLGRVICATNGMQQPLRYSKQFLPATILHAPEDER